jgi:hypothetical protein
MFDVSRSLLQMLEVVAMEAPEVLLDSEMNQSRLAELVLQLLTRTLGKSVSFVAAPEARHNLFLRAGM